MAFPASIRLLPRFFPDIGESMSCILERPIEASLRLDLVYRKA